MTTERWLVTGASGKLGGAVIDHLAREANADRILALSGRRTGSIAGVSLRPFDLIADGSRPLDEFRPTHVLHLGGVTSIAECREDPDQARAVNVEATRALCDRAREVGARFLFTSTDMVFGGDRAPYDETSDPDPLSLYGRTKVEAEAALADLDATVVRVGLLVGPSPGPGGSGFEKFVAALHGGTPQRLFTDEVRSPLSHGDAARALVAIARAGLPGITHLGGPERLSRLEIGERIAAAVGAKRAELIPTSRLDFEAPEPRPADLSLDSSKLVRALPDAAPRPLSPEALS